MALVDSLTVSVRCSGPGNNFLASKTKFSIPVLTAGNFASTSALVATLAATYNNLTDGILANTSVAIEANVNAAAPPGTANRGQKWILTARNPVGRPFTYTIPAAPGGGELQSDNISADLTGATWASFLAAFEALCTDPFGQSLTLETAKLGGRRR